MKIRVSRTSRKLAVRISKVSILISKWDNYKVKFREEVAGIELYIISFTGQMVSRQFYFTTIFLFYTRKIL